VTRYIADRVPPKEFASLDGKLLASNMLFDMKTRRQGKTAEWYACFGKDASTLLKARTSESESGKTILSSFNVGSGENKDIASLDNTEDKWTSFRISSNGMRICAANEGQLYQFELESGKLSYICGLPSNNEGLALYGFSGDAEYIYCSSSSNEILKISLIDKSCEVLFDGSNPTLSEDGEYMAYTTSNKEVISVRRLSTGEVWNCEVSDSLNSVHIGSYALSPNGEFLAVWQNSTSSIFMRNAITIYNYQTGKKFNRYSGNGTSYSGGEYLEWKK
jgi:hypothetical protein